MKITDTLKLVKHEYRYGKTEWISSLFMHTVVITCILMTVTIALEIGHVCNDYIDAGNPDGYIFYLNGFDKNDSAWLEKRGFFDISFPTEGGLATAGTDNIEKIWFYKFQALFSGKDLWNEELDSMLEIILFGHVIFTAIAGILCIIMLNSTSNSFSMKLEERKKYIAMLVQLGAAKKDCFRIFWLFFIARGLAALIFSVFFNAVILHYINRYIVNEMHIPTAFSVFRPEVMAGIIILSILVMGISFHNIWREKNER